MLLLFLVPLSLLGCRRDDGAPPVPVYAAFGLLHPEVEFWPYEQPQITHGEMDVGGGGDVLVYDAPPNAEIQLYRGLFGQGPGPCTFIGGACAGLIDPELIVTATADADGVAKIELIDDLGSPMSIAWQALVVAPDLTEVAAFTPVIVRHLAVPVTEAATRFRAVTRHGLQNLYTSGNTHTGGVAWADTNGDLLPDLVIANGTGSQNYLYRNAGGGQFVNESEAIQKPDINLECAAVSYADVDNDGDLDLLFPVDNSAQMLSSVAQDYSGGPNLFYLNNGDGTFAERAATSGVLDPRGYRNSAASMTDYDLDGCVDTYLVNWAMAAAPGADNFDRLLKGNCDGTFTDVSGSMGIDAGGRDGLVAFWWDADFDLYPELYLGNNSDLDEPPVFQPDDNYYKNEAGLALRDWTSENPGVGEDAWAAMGIDVGDIDGDQDWDLYITDVWSLPPEPNGNVLYLGNPDGTLSANVCQEHNLCFGYNSWPESFQDFDNDGWIDLWVASSNGADPNLLYINRGDGSGVFDVHRQAEWSGYWSRAGTSADYDGDGDVDLFLWVDGADSVLYENDLANDNHWAEFRLIGEASNRAGLGAVARVRTHNGLPRQMRRVSGGDSAHSQADLTLHFGLAEATDVAELEISWPSGAVQTLEDLPADRFYLIAEGAGVVPQLITDASATWDALTSTLTIAATTNYGGQTVVDAALAGVLTYDASDQNHRGSFVLATRLDTVYVAPRFGDGVYVTVGGDP